MKIGPYNLAGSLTDTEIRELTNVLEHAQEYAQNAEAHIRNGLSLASYVETCLIDQAGGVVAGSLGAIGGGVSDTLKSALDKQQTAIGEQIRLAGNYTNFP